MSEYIEVLAVGKMNCRFYFCRRFKNNWRVKNNGQSTFKMWMSTEIETLKDGVRLWEMGK